MSEVRTAGDTALASITRQLSRESAGRSSETKVGREEGMVVLVVAAIVFLEIWCRLTGCPPYSIGGVPSILKKMARHPVQGVFHFGKKGEPPREGPWDRGGARLNASDNTSRLFFLFFCFFNTHVSNGFSQIHIPHR